MGTVQDLEFEVSCLGFRVPSLFGFRVSSADSELWISGFEFRVSGVSALGSVLIFALGAMPGGGRGAHSGVRPFHQ